MSDTFPIAIFASAILCTASALAETKIVFSDSGNVTLRAGEPHQQPVQCDTDQDVVSGGFLVRLNPALVRVEASFPQDDRKGWIAILRNASDTPVVTRITTEAICIDVPLRK